LSPADAFRDVGGAITTKTILGLAAAAAVVLPIVVPAAAMADRSSVNTIPGLGAQRQLFNTGGGDFGRGTAELVGRNAPAPCGCTDQNSI
jgi:hypothetical protein